MSTSAVWIARRRSAVNSAAAYSRTWSWVKL
jgi:hypothetical protein